MIGRDRLFAEIDQYSGAPGLWVAGPPGIGKTTLVATYLDARAIPCVWLQLDAGEADAASFVHFLRAAAARLAPQRKLRMPLPSADDLRDVTGLIRRCFRQLVDSIEPPWALVLDNTQELGVAPALHGGIAAALAELPAHARLIVVSREPPGPEYARAIAGQQLATIEASALRFNTDETLQLLDVHKRNWQPAALHRASDGWAAAMILMLAARQDLQADTASPGSAARDSLFDLFAGEVIQGMEPGSATALMKIAFLPHATAAMAVAISGNPQAAGLLADLARRSLFTDCRHGTPPTYTFHALFGEFLRARAAAHMDGQALHTLRIQAAQLLGTHGQLDAAINQLMDAHAWDAALALLLKHAGSFVAQGRTSAVHHWLMAVPDAHQATAPVAYWLGYCEMASDPTRALQRFEQAHLGFVAMGDVRGSFLAASAAADAMVFIGASLAALSTWLPVLEAYAPTYLVNRDTETDLRVLPGLLAAFVHRETAHPLTAPLADLAERLLDQPLAASQRILLGSLAYYLLWTGQTVRLDRIIVKIDRMCADQDVAAATLLRWYGVVVLICSLLGRAQEALDNSTRALALARHSPPALRTKAHLMMVLAALAARDSELARAHLHETASLLDSASPIDTTTYEFQRGILMLLDGDWGSAALLMRAAVASGYLSGWPLREHIALLGQTLAATQVGAFAEAEDTLQKVLTHRFYAMCPWHQWLAALIEAQLADQLGDNPRCLAGIERAFTIGRRCGFDFGPMPYCCGSMMSRLASLALWHDIDRPFALQIIRRYALPAPANASEQWPWPIRIRTLGQFSIEIDGAPAKSSRKESRKPLDLLKLLTAHVGMAVPVAHLCAVLWPDAQGDAARNSFDNALHRLRKLLGADQHVQLVSGALGLNPATCWTDAAALEACLAAVDCLAPEAGVEPVTLLAERALNLYRGEFLAGEEDLPDALLARERILARFTRHMAALGGRLQTLGDPAAAVRIFGRMLEQQPLAEDIYRRQITCLLALGQPAEAYEAYRRCRQQLSVVLGIRPAPETEALVAGLRNL